MQAASCLCPDIDGVQLILRHVLKLLDLNSAPGKLGRNSQFVSHRLDEVAKRLDVPIHALLLRCRDCAVVDVENRSKSSVRSKVEHPFRVLKRVFGFDKVRGRGLAKNHHRLCANFALVNLYMHRKRLAMLG